MNAPAKIEAAQPRVAHKSMIAALAAALSEVEGALKDTHNPHLKSKYADLASVIDAIRPIARHGLWFRQVPKPDDAGARIETFYIHETGEMSAGEMFIPASKRDPQGFGSAITYCRRYALQTAFGIAPEDDDGHSATTSCKNEKEAASKPKLAPREDVHASKGIPDAEWAKIVQLVEVTGSDTVALCKYYKINSLRDMEFDQYSHAMKMLNAKITKKREEEAKAKQAANGFGELIDDEIPF